MLEKVLHIVHYMLTYQLIGAVGDFTPLVLCLSPSALAAAAVAAAAAAAAAAAGPSSRAHVYHPTPEPYGN